MIPIDSHELVILISYPSKKKPIKKLDDETIFSEWVTLEQAAILRYKSKTRELMFYAKDKNQGIQKAVLETLSKAMFGSVCYEEYKAKEKFDLDEIALDYAGEDNANSSETIRVACTEVETASKSLKRIDGKALSKEDVKHHFNDEASREDGKTYSIKKLRLLVKVSEKIQTAKRSKTVKKDRYIKFEQPNMISISDTAFHEIEKWMEEVRIFDRGRTKPNN